MNNIYLSRISIHDFRTFGEFEVEIPAAPGLVLLTGTNGLGKSSFFDAIEWGLTGTIRRFTPYLQKGRKKHSERDYLTRRGAEPGSHKVALTFSDGEPVERSAEKTTSKASIISQLARADRRAIDDLGTYLALTHFLGQAAHQRFTSREPEDQWEALKGPSGIERLERIRAGLRGRPTMAAFTRRVEQQEGAVALLERQIADWQGWLSRLERLRQAARATGVLTTAEVTERVDALEVDLSQVLGGNPIAITGENLSQRLTGLGDRIGHALAEMAERDALLVALADLPTQFTAASANARLDHPVLVRTRQAVSDARAEIVRTSPGAEATGRAVSTQNAAIATIGQNIALLDAARTDLARRTQLAGQIAAAKIDLTALTSAVTTHRAALADADAVVQQHADAVAEAARLRSVAHNARALVGSHAELLDLETVASRGAAALVAGREAAATAQQALDPLNVEMSDLTRRIGEAIQARADAGRHSDAISAALAQLASHIHDGDTECPVCQSPFEPGVLKSLAEAAAASSDSRLASADEEVERLRREESDLIARIALLKTTIDLPIQLERDVTASAAALTNARASLALALGIDAADDLGSAAVVRERNAALALTNAEAALEPLAARAAAASEQRVSMTTELEEQIAREGQVTTRLETLGSEDRACAERIAARGLADASLESLEARLSQQRVQLEDSRSQLGRLSEAAVAAAASLELLRATLDGAERGLVEAESARAGAEAASQEFAVRWANAGFDGSPSAAGLDRSKAGIADTLVALRSLGERQLVLARDNEDALLQSEVDEVLAAMRQAGGEAGVTGAAAHLSSMEEKLSAAREALKLTNAARNAVKRHTEQLKTQSDDFSNRVLDPLNVVIDDFNEAMLSTPGESIQFKTDTRVDASSLAMALRYREKVEHAIEAKKDLPPQMVLSEGQLAANGFSILCAASTAYPWSRWRALLLDDPLQHNDIIHTAAFVDVMRNMVELDGYQLIISSHDRGESDFIARKFDAAGLPCSTILLTAPSEKGVVYEGPDQNQAANRILRATADQMRSNSA